jgi:hypothetical protein
MNEFDMITHAQASAPSYLKLKDDGADMKCIECGKRDRELFIKTFTPDGKNHFAVHKTCVDEEWLANAKDMGWF